MTLRCDICAPPDVIAVKPGTEAPRFADLFRVTRPVRTEMWCADHWPWLCREPSPSPEQVHAV